MKENKIMLSDIAGYKEEKAEVQKFIKLFKNFEKYKEAGVYVPKGLVLQGPPGCGKTLFAKAIASECGIPFFTFQADSDAKESQTKLMELFKKAKKKTPAIIYIDELDKLTSSRFLSSDAIRTTIQYLLTELDGLSTEQGVFVIASTNAYCELPDSLVRSGRIDKKILIDLPNLESRVAILEHYIKKHKIFDNVNIKSLALKIDGMSGADIKTLINNALIEYLDSDKVLTTDDFVDLINQMHFEDIGRRWSNKKTVTKVLIHEVGHSIVNYCLTGKCGAISGVRYGDSAGHTDFDDEETYEAYTDGIISLEELEELEDSNISKQEMLNSIAAYFAGMMAEEAFYGCFDSGGVSDIMGAVRTFDRMASYFFYDSKFINLDVERLVDARIVRKYLNLRDRVFRKQKAICRKHIKKNKYLIRYIVDEAIAHEDALNSTQIHNCIDYYNEHKKEIDTKYKNLPLVDNKKDKETKRPE